MSVVCLNLWKAPGFVFHLAHTVFKCGKEVSPGQLDEYASIAKWQLLQNITARQGGSGFVEPIAAYSPAIDQRHVGLQRLAQRVGDKIAHGAFARAYLRSLAVQGRLRLAHWLAQFLFQCGRILRHLCRHAGSGVTPRLAIMRQDGVTVTCAPLSVTFFSIVRSMRPR